LKKKNKLKINFSSNNELNLFEYTIQFKSKSKKILENIENIENLEKINIENKDKEKNKKISKKHYKKRKFKKKFTIKKN